ncbi:hypothetical protein AFE_2416 [Acidithiobacillus ferrooxidans ATCC 23270]|jgi:hypothetical protein|uniref:Uncharacterized protein n=1 Tax=Acidithiobacillus ferrooxidans (strain ATCC 23270 / DSM 14882 / CIP 104768 / NCIMB 8455) TaxID=243159 RepID=B7J6H7_ACIF2|nr:hypothetical protein AFE_2416 [Acidithiobacillus ferrooxidans ATCC 23270]
MRKRKKSSSAKLGCKSNMALNFGRWALRDKAAQRQLALRYIGIQ